MPCHSRRSRGAARHALAALVIAPLLAPATAIPTPPLPDAGRYLRALPAADERNADTGLLAAALVGALGLPWPEATGPGPGAQAAASPARTRILLAWSFRSPETGAPGAAAALLDSCGHVLGRRDGLPVGRPVVDDAGEALVLVGAEPYDGDRPAELWALADDGTPRWRHTPPADWEGALEAPPGDSLLVLRGTVPDPAGGKTRLAALQVLSRDGRRLVDARGHRADLIALAFAEGAARATRPPGRACLEAADLPESAPPSLADGCRRALASGSALSAAALQGRLGLAVPAGERDARMDGSLLAFTDTGFGLLDLAGYATRRCCITLPYISRGRVCLFDTLGQVRWVRPANLAPAPLLAADGTCVLFDGGDARDADSLRLTVLDSAGRRRARWSTALSAFSMMTADAVLLPGDSLVALWDPAVERDSPQRRPGEGHGPRVHLVDLTGHERWVRDIPFRAIGGLFVDPAGSGIRLLGHRASASGAHGRRHGRWATGDAATDSVRVVTLDLQGALVGATTFLPHERVFLLQAFPVDGGRRLLHPRDGAVRVMDTTTGRSLGRATAADLESLRRARGQWAGRVACDLLRMCRP